MEIGRITKEVGKGVRQESKGFGEAEERNIVEREEKNIK